jgi:5,10-methylenetetrahydromethanopterin reductase
MGQRPLRWAYVSAYVRVLRALLRGEDVEWEGGMLRMLHPHGYGAPRPLDVPFVVAAAGPKGITAAREVGDGVFGALSPIPGFAWSVVLTFGTVLDEGEDPGSPRALAAAGHGASVAFHYALEHRLLDVVPRGAEWAAAYGDVPARLRHLALHDRHLIAVNDRDRPFVSGALVAEQGLALGRDAWRERVESLEAAGATEIAYQPAGPDIPRELAAFASAVRG